ncbi:MAG TPA: phytoene/squalene synthase family protein [Gemmatimonadaceae bacterium]|nr:phytoene/squalene synthase family protein [Gemmatimonadaceae bacterium]
MTDGTVITDNPVRAARSVRDAEEFCERLLPRVSRTFAISIRLLPGELGRSVLCAYLLCRVADTIEDEHNRSAGDKARLLDAMLVAFSGVAEANAFQAQCANVTGDPAHAELVHGAADVFTLWRDLPERSREHVRRWVDEMVRGMRKIVLAHPSGVRLQTLDDYREYCYYVAGTVGYMLTDLWREHSPPVTERVYDALKLKARAFGEALQTVNILKDVAVDAERENNIYIPEQLLRAHGSSHATILSPAHETANHAALATLIQLAWKNLDDARDYLLLVPRRAFAVRLFCVLPLLYAYATLRELTKSRAMLRSGGNVKISRREVRTLMFAGMALACSNSGIAWLVRRVRRA